ncbi:MAG: DUF305 domain-containing protein [Nitrospira sp.]|nr:DUF305 domain-containing protein [Nitrospira sp.]
MKKFLFVLTVILLLLCAGRLSAGEQGHGTANITSENMKYKSASPAMMHMSHSDMVKSEKEFVREMIPHHQEAVDTSVLLFISTDDPELKMLTEAIYNAQTAEILDMRLSYARWYNLIPTGFMYQSMMRDLNIVTGRERDIRYVQDMIMHHKGALEMAEKVLTFKGIHEETVMFAKDIIKNQKMEIDFMQKWLKKVGVSH